MSRPILSRPRTRVYGCNYDKGESYYKPMVDHLDRKYSGRPLFAEPRNSLADEIAARRSDIGSRSLAGTRNDSFDDLEFIYDGRGRAIPEDTFEDEFVATHRRFKERAASAFEDDMAELRRKRKDMQDRMFDMIDINAEIERAKSTLEAADSAFQRHAVKFDNVDDMDDMSLSQRMERSRKLSNIEVVEKPKPKPPLFKWTRLMDSQNDPTPTKALKGRQARINSLIADNILTDNAGDDDSVTQPKRRSFLKRKKSVSF